jgi:glycosyltransferase involved in cell wall biosynthesis
VKISIVLPAKNESAAIGQTIKHIQKLEVIAEIIVVNDGSTDQTKQVAEQAGAKVISHPYSKGNGAAIKTGAAMLKVRSLYLWMLMVNMIQMIFLNL